MNQRYQKSAKSFIPFGILTFLLWISAGSLFAQNLQISGGNSFSVALCDNKFVYAWGLNNAGQFGLNAAGVANPLTSSATPQKVYYKIPAGLPSAGTVTDLVVKQVDAGSGSHAIALACDGLTYVWGETTCGQNGIGQAIGAECECGTSVPQSGPKPVKAGAADAAHTDANGYLIGVVYVSGANNASFAILDDGKVMAWGENSFGQLGIGNVTDQNLPQYVLGPTGTPLTGIVQIEGGDRVSYALDNLGQVWSWGLNSDNKELGRGTLSAAAGVLATAPTCALYITNRQYDPRAGRVEKGSGGFLTGMTQVSGGDTHGLAISSTGEVWSWGGNWGGTTGTGGQLGWGLTMDYTPVGSFAGRVVAVGNTANQAPPYLQNVVYVAAGQSSSAAVLADGRVVVWGGNGFFQACGSNTAGVIANGVQAATGACPVTAGNKGTGAPVYVNTAPGVPLTGISRISDGDAWYFAQGTSGNFAWGWNQNGESAIAGNTNHNLATTFSLPAGCVLGDPCPVADLGADFTSCPVFSTPLYAGSSSVSYTYTWYYKTTNGPWVAGDIIAGPTAGAAGESITANKIGFYRVLIHDIRPSTAGSCVPCPDVTDVVQISLVASPYSGTACFDATAGKSKFTITPAGTYNWYTAVSGGATVGSTNPITVNTSTLVAVPGCTKPLFAQDMSSFTGALMPALPCALGTGANTTNSVYTMITVNQSADITDVSFVQGNGWGAGTYSLILHNNVASGGPYCGECSPNGNYAGPVAGGITIESGKTYPDPGTPTVRNWTLAAPYTINAGTYWLEIKATAGALQAFDCTSPALAASSSLWTTPITEAGGVLVAKSALDGSNFKGKGGIYNIKYQAGAAYSCGRILVCADGNTCVLPVELLNFEANKVNGFNLLTWSTASEKNNARFDIQRSEDGTNFFTIGKVDGNGNSSSLLNYSFKDYANVSGTLYYRLAQYDYDGKMTLSETKVVSSEGQEELAKLLLYPNPNKGSFTVTLSGVSGDVRFNITSAVGQSIYTATSSSEGSLEKVIDLTGASKGVYFVTVTTVTKSWTEKVVVE